MQQIFPVQKKLAQSNIPVQILALATSVGVHYLLVSNLGLLARFDPPQIRPINGGVKVVDLTPAEQTRVPEAVKSNPLPIAPSPVSPEPATRQPFTLNNPIPFSPSPVVVPTPTAVPASPNQPSTSKTPNPQKTLPKPDRTSPQDQLGINANIKIPKFRSAPTVSDNPDKPGVGKPNTNGNDPGSGKTSEPPSNNESPTVPQPATPPTSTKPPRRQSDNIDQKRNDFDQNVKNLIQQFGGGQVIERPPQRLPIRSYPAVRRCSGQKNGVILIAILLDENGARLGSDVPSRLPEELGERVGNDFFFKHVIEAEEMAIKQHADRSNQQKLAEKGKNVLYKFTFEYAASSCPF